MADKQDGSQKWIEVCITLKTIFGTRYELFEEEAGVGAHKVPDAKAAAQFVAVTFQLSQKYLYRESFV